MKHRPLVSLFSLCAAVLMAAPLGAEAQHVHVAATAAESTSIFGWFTNYGHYVPRIHCLQKADGTPDWFWITGLIVATLTVIGAYLRIYWFWLKCYLAEQPENRNPKLLTLANIFLLCASTGYALSVLMFIWPAYRLVFFVTLALSFFAISFNVNLKDFASTFHAVRLLRERNAAQGALAAQVQALKTVLDNMGDGLLTVDTAGKIVGERSRMVNEWFGSELPASLVLAEYLYPSDEHARDAFDLAYTQVTDGLLPIELCIDQLPTRLTTGGKVLALRYRPVSRDGALEGLVVVISDVTAQLEAERRDREAREVQHLVGQLLSDLGGFRKFVEEGTTLVQRICDPATSREALLRHLHTLKGNAYVYGARSMGDVCHAVEHRLFGGETDVDLTGTVGAAWNALFDRIHVFMEGRLESLQVSSIQYETLRARLREREDHAHILSEVEQWRHEQSGPILRRLGAQVERIADSLGRKVDVVIDDGGVVLPPQAFDPLWSALVHVVRNAVYHGIEPSELRSERGKPETGTVALSTKTREDGRLSVDVRDDGRGIDFAALRRAAGAGDEVSDDELVERILSGGLSSAEEANEIAGRGVGVSAVKQACEALGGRMRVDTEAGKGTCFHFSFPPPSMA